MEIECSFRLMEWYSDRFYTCNVKSSSITKRGTRVTSFKGLHQEGKSNADVEFINFINTVVEYFPLGLYKIFPNLKGLQVHNCGLKEISRRDFKGLDSLTTLWLSYNQLKFLQDNLLSGMTKLTRVFFYNNKLEFVSSKLLQPIKDNELVYVDFEGNPTMDCRFEPGSEYSLGSLQELCDIIDKNCKKPMAARQDPGAEDFAERIFRCFKGLWTSGHLSDFVIACGLKEFRVHKVVLSAQSSVLAAAFQIDMQESKIGRMEIKDFSKEAVEDFLQFMYTGETPEETNAMEILALASKYDVPALQQLMEEIVLDNLDATNAIEILTLSKHHDSEFLAEEAFKEIQEIFPETELDPTMVDNPERLKQLIDAKREYERVLKSCLKNQN